MLKRLGLQWSGRFERAGRSHEADARPFDILSELVGFEPTKALLALPPCKGGELSLYSTAPASAPLVCCKVQRGFLFCNHTVSLQAGQEKNENIKNYFPTLGYN